MANGLSARILRSRGYSFQHLTAITAAYLILVNRRPAGSKTSSEAALNFNNGPSSDKKAIIGKHDITHYRANRFIDTIGIELSESHYGENSKDPRGFAAAVADQGTVYKLTRQDQ